MSLPRFLFSSSFSNALFSCSLLASFLFISLIVKSIRSLLSWYIKHITAGIIKRINTTNAVTVAPHKTYLLESKTEYYKHINRIKDLQIFMTDWKI